MKKFKFLYEYKKNFNPKYANGAFGGVTGRGEIVINFFAERPQMFLEMTQELEGTKLGKVEDLSPSDMDTTFVRNVHSGVMMRYDDAKDLHKWLGEQLAHVEKELNKSKNVK